jgi:hypothetical protein
MADFPTVDFSPIGDLANVYNAARQKATREQVLSRLGQGDGPLDYGSAAKQLLAAGDTEGGLSLARLAQQQYLTSPDYITQSETAKAKVAEQFAPKTTDITLPGGDKVTVQKGPTGYTVPTVQGMPAPTPGTEVPAGVDPKEYRKRLADAHVTNQEDSVKSAKAAADFQPIVDQAVAAYERAIASGAVGPITASPAGRAIGKYVTGSEAEKARQDYDLARSALQARITAAQNKGEGAVSNFERQMYAAQFPDLTSIEPDKQLQYLKQIQAQTRQTQQAGQIPALGQAPQVGAVMNRPSIPNGNQTPANPNAWRTKETITAARANPQGALAEAKAAIDAGADPAVVIQRLRQVGIDPSPLTAQPTQPGFAGPAQRQ